MDISKGFSWARMVAGPLKDERMDQPMPTDPCETLSDKNENKLTSQLRVLENELERGRAEARVKQADLQDRLVRAEQQLKETRKKLLRLLPQQEWSDETVAQAFEDLYLAIEDFVDTHLPNVTNLNEKVDHDKVYETEPTFLHTTITAEDVAIATEYPEAVSCVLSNALFTILFDQILDDARWHIGLFRDEENPLNMIAEQLKARNKDEDDSIHRRWCSETYRALANHTGSLRDLEQEGMIWLSREIVKLVKHFVEVEEGHILEARVMSALVVPCIRLQGLIKGSISGYKLVFLSTKDSPVDNCSNIRGKTDRTIDGVTGQEVRLKDIDTVALRLCVFPRLVKVESNGREHLLHGATILIARQKEPTEVE